MVWALLPLLVLALIFGVTAIERDLATKPPPAAPSPVSSAEAAAQEFMAYRNAAMSYAQQQLISNPNSRGEIQPATLVQGQYLSQAESNALPAGSEAVYASTLIGNSGIYGVATPSGSPGFVVCVWMPAPKGTVGLVVNYLVDWYGGDLTLGMAVDNNGNWRQVGAGGKVQMIPELCMSYAALDGKAPPPALSLGDVVSVVGLGGG